MKIKTLLWTGFVALGALMAVLVAIALVQLNAIEGHIDNIVRAGRNEATAREISHHVDGVRRHQRSAIVSPQDAAQELERSAVAGKDNAKLAEELESRQRNPETKQLAGHVRALNEQYARSNEQLVALQRDGKADAMTALIQGDARKVQRELAAEVSKFIKIQEERKAQAEKATEAAHLFASRLMSGLLALAVVLAIAVAWQVTHRIASQLGGEPETARQLVQRIADGDLSQDLPVAAGDSHSLMAHQQQMQLRLRAMLNSISSAVSRTEGAAGELATSAQQVAAASRSTSDSATSMAAVVEEMSVSISQVSDNARDALKTASRAAELSDSGGTVIEQAATEINNIAGTVKRTSEAMSVLDVSSAKISTVVQVIKEVADQTNLLALNAAIEAARAGESGRGFAVVADEVRKLAERTGKATNEINAMVVQIQDETRNSLTLMETAVQQVDRGVELAGSAGAAIRNIRGSVDQMVSVVNDIGSAIAEQSVASQQIAQRVEQVAQASEENNAAAQQTASAASTLNGLAVGLRQNVAQFKT
ncbi:MAG: methyl-accepting chemotaxis protein [Elusimicrobia bacterium]|nr:MAG: methyl-accepting chemotaxis protein [Elusimicrobiota bacterium]